MTGGIADHLKRQRLQGIAAKNRRRVVPFLVNRRLATAHVVIVHARQVIMHKAVSMQRFNRAGWVDRAQHIRAAHTRAFSHEKGAQALTARCRIAHCLHHRHIGKA